MLVIRDFSHQDVVLGKRYNLNINPLAFLDNAQIVNKLIKSRKEFVKNLERMK
jgi:hypothetical protein